MVIEVYSKGYRLNSEVLRAPKVRIGKPASIDDCSCKGDGKNSEEGDIE